MPALPNVPNVLRCFIEGFIDGDLTYKWGNVLFFEYTGGAPSPSDCSGFATHIASSWASNMASSCPSPTTLTKVTVTDLTSATSSEGAWAGSHAGTRGDDSIPANACLLISYPAGGLRYRGGHPRSYLYVLGNADLEGAAHWAESSRASVENNWGSFIDDMPSFVVGGTTIGPHVAVSYRHAGAVRTTPVVLALGRGTAAAEMASQRRRIGRRKHRR